MSEEEQDFKSKLRVLKANQQIKVSNANQKLNVKILDLVEQESNFLFEEFKANRGKLSEKDLNELINKKEIRLKEIEFNIRKIAQNKCNYFIWDLTFIDGVV